MAEDRDLLERVSTLEVQVKDIAEIKSKIDVLYDLIVEMKVANANQKSDFATKAECKTCQQGMEARFAKMESGRQKLFWAVISSGLVFVFWLMEQLLHISVHVG